MTLGIRLGRPGPARRAWWNIPVLRGSRIVTLGIRLGRPGPALHAWGNILVLRGSGIATLGIRLGRPGPEPVSRRPSTEPSMWTGPALASRPAPWASRRSSRSASTWSGPCWGGVSGASLPSPGYRKRPMRTRAPFRAWRLGHRADRRGALRRGVVLALATSPAPWPRRRRPTTPIVVVVFDVDWACSGVSPGAVGITQNVDAGPDLEWTFHGRGHQHRGRRIGLNLDDINEGGFQCRSGVAKTYRSQRA